VLRRRGHAVEAERLAAAIPPFEPFLDRFQANGDAAFASDTQTTALWHAYYRAIVQDGVGSLDHDELGACIDEVIHRYGLPEYWEAYPDVAPTLAEGRRRGLIQGVISDWGSRLTAILHGIGLTDQLDFVVVSAVVGAAKPDRHVFDLALRRAGVGPEEAVYVGDTYRADVLGGRSAGLLAVLLDRSGAVPRIDGPLIRRLDEVFRLIDDVQRATPALC
jgi:putative hydrolase of the HAD superfamily